MIYKFWSKISAFLKYYWNIYGSLIISIFMGWLSNWNAGQMQSVNQYLGILISCICLFTIVKTLVLPKIKKKTVLEKIATSQKNVSNMTKSIDPQATIDDTIVLLQTSVKGGKKVMTKVKNVFKWIVTYKEQLIGLIGEIIYAFATVFCLVTDRLGFVYDIIPDEEGWHIGAKILLGLISCVILFFGTRNQIVWRGVGSLEKAREFFKALAEEKQAEQGNNIAISNKNKNRVATYIKYLKKSIKDSEKKLADEKVAYNEAVDNFNFFQQLEVNGVPFNVAERDEITNLCAEKKNSIATIENTIRENKELLDKYEELLNK